MFDSSAAHHLFLLTGSQPILVSSLPDSSWLGWRDTSPCTHSPGIFWLHFLLDCSHCNFHACLSSSSSPSLLAVYHLRYRLVYVHSHVCFLTCFHSAEGNLWLDSSTYDDETHLNFCKVYFAWSSVVFQSLLNCSHFIFFLCLCVQNCYEMFNNLFVCGFIQIGDKVCLVWFILFCGAMDWSWVSIGFEMLEFWIYSSDVGN